NKTMRLAHFALTAAAAVAASLPASALADLSFNAGVVSDYRYRGISQSRLKPALQGGVDYAAGGLYVGAWGSTIKWIKDAGTLAGANAGSTNVEIDLYGGYKGELAKDLTYDVGGLYYLYPGNKYKDIGGDNANTFELYGALTYGPVTAKYSHAVTSVFGNPDSKNSFYLDASATFDVGGFSVVPHVGYQKIKGPFSGPATYTDYSLTVSREFSGVVVSLAVVGTDADKAFYSSPVNGKELGKSGVVLGAKVNF
ncbi:MAG TPA: TorF family putative porin, partial [Burkholderiaceae bacterium]|nr:TorF family putative porin [Burkholderiaceae bacterium]